MAYERLVGIHVTDDKMYQKYREAMKPILETYGGGFSSDFKIAETLKPTEHNDINRVFTIYCRDKDAMKEFFSNVEYLKVKEKYFSKSVTKVVELAAYNK